MSEVDLQPVLTGTTIRLRPLEQDDFAALHLAASDPGIWAQHPDCERYKRDVFRRRFFDGALESCGALVIEELDSGRVIGSSRFYEWVPAQREIAIGYTFIERGHWGDGTNDELKRLMLQHIFRWADVVWFHVAEINLRSRRAVEKLGAALAFEEERALDGKKYRQLYYRLESSR